MKKILLISLLFLFNIKLISQTLIAGWDFQTTTNGGTAVVASPNTPKVFMANIGNGNIYLDGTNGSSNWNQSGELSGFGGSNLNTNGTSLNQSTTSPSCLALINTTANGKSIVFNINMNGYKDLNVSYVSNKTSTGFNNHLWEYSTNGTSWTTLTTVTSITTSFSTINLPTISSLNGISSSFLRLTLNGCTSISGNNKLDNIQFKATVVCNSPTLTTTTTTGLTEQCTDGTSQFTYYGDATNPSQFAIKKNGNTISATVDIVRNSSVIPSTSTSGTNKEHASYLMGSSWDVTTSSTITNPVTIRFYYLPTDTLAAKTARDNAYNTLLATNPSTLAVKSNNIEWFKTVGVPYNSSWTSTIVGNQFPSSYLKLTPTYGTENMVNYVEFSGITSFSGGTGGYSFGEANSTGASALPVLWGQVWIDQSKSQLNWETLSELNSNYFEIEASDDAIHFITISEKITAKGISQAKEKYTYELGSLFNYYYRIKQFDKDGQFQYSKITYNPSVVKKEIPVKPIQISYDDLNKYVNLTFNNTSDRVQKIVISNISGQVFLNDNLEPNSSKTILTSELNLQDGMYFVNILGESHREKFMIKK